MPLRALTCRACAQPRKDISAPQVVSEDGLPHCIAACFLSQSSKSDCDMTYKYAFML